METKAKICYFILGRSVSFSSMFWSLFQAPMHVYIFTIAGSIKINVKSVI